MNKEVFEQTRGCNRINNVLSTCPKKIIVALYDRNNNWHAQMIGYHSSILPLQHCYLTEVPLSLL